MEQPRHPLSVEGGHRCRLCTANDADGLVEQLAEDLWESRRYGTLDDVPFAECGEYWRSIFREFARAAVQSLQTASPS